MKETLSDIRLSELKSPPYHPHAFIIHHTKGLQDLPLVFSNFWSTEKEIRIAMRDSVQYKYHCDISISCSNSDNFKV